jgi:hypothetical protein
MHEKTYRDLLEKHDSISFQIWQNIIPQYIPSGKQSGPHTRKKSGPHTRKKLSKKTAEKGTEKTDKKGK